MVFSLLARLLLRIDHKTALPRLNLYLHGLRMLEFMSSTAFLGIFLHFALGLPHGYDISNKMTAVYAMAIVTAVYPVLIWFLWLALRKRRRVLYFRITRTTDSIVVAPILIALAVVLGNAGLPTTCEQLYIFDRHEYYLIGKRSSNITVQCSPIAAMNECGTGTRQINEVGKVCQTARAGFSLVIVSIVAVYLMIALVTLYLFFKPRDDVDPSAHRRHRRGPSLANGASESTQRLTNMSQIERSVAAHIANGETAPGEPPPPYTSRPGHGERIASADEVRRTTMMTSLANDITASLARPREGSERLSTGTADHPVFALARTDSVIGERSEEEIQPERRTVIQANPRLIIQSSREMLASRSASLREASDPVSPIEVEASSRLPITIRAVSNATNSSAATAINALPSQSPVSPIDQPLGTTVVDLAVPSSPKQNATEAGEAAKQEPIPSSAQPSRGSWANSITVMLDNVGDSSHLARGGSNASAPAAMN